MIDHAPPAARSRYVRQRQPRADEGWTLRALPAPAPIPSVIKVGGYGREHYGDPFGAGGPLYVVRALAVGGRTVRVVFDEAPVFRSAGGANDALNPQNFVFSVDSGIATAPLATGVLPVMVTGPARGVGNGSAPNVADERAVDVAVDRALVQGITYRVTAQSIQAALGGDLGAPYSQAFPGVVPLQVVPPRVTGRPSTNVDLGNELFGGSWRADDSGDLATQDAASGYKKRVLRRLTTVVNSFSFLAGYGVGVKLKEVANLRQISALKGEAETQIRLEPETAEVSVQASISALGVLTVFVQAKTRQGAFVEASLTLDPAGTVTTS